MVSLVSDLGAIIAAGLFGVGLGIGIIGGAEIGRLIHRATDAPGEKRVIDWRDRPPLDGPE